MAININNEYPTKTDPATAEYPQGKARNVSNPGDRTGTPWDERLVNDIIGFLQGLLASANLTPSGDPDNALDSQYRDAILAIAGGFTEQDFLDAVDDNNIALLGPAGRRLANGAQTFDRAIGTRTDSLNILAGAADIDWGRSNSFFLFLTEDVALNSLNFLGTINAALEGAPYGGYTRLVVVQTNGGGHALTDPTANTFYKGIPFDPVTRAFDIGQGPSDITLLEFHYIEQNGTRFVTATDMGPFTAPVATVPGVPTNLIASNPTETTIQLNWDAQADASSFRVYRSLNTPVTLGDNNEVVFMNDNLVTGLLPDTQYYFAVLAANTNGDSDLSAEATATTTAVAVMVDIPDPLQDGDIATTPNTAVSGFSFSPSGAITKFGITSFVGTWAAPGVNAADYEIMLDQVTASIPGSTLNGAGNSPVGVWLSLSSNRQWANFDSTQTPNALSARIRIRRVLTGVVEDEVIANWSAIQNLGSGGGGGGGGGGCFTCDTLVTMSDGSTKEIQDINIGEFVMGADGSSARVTKLFRAEYDADLYGINGSEPFFTVGHPFSGQNSWLAIDPEVAKREVPEIDTQAMKVGDVLNTDDSHTIVTSLGHKDGRGSVVYNITVERHTYIANGFYVHNVSKV